MSFDLSTNVHATRIQLVLRGGGIAFINIYTLVFICTATPIIYTLLYPQHKEGTKETNERTRRRVK